MYNFVLPFFCFGFTYLEGVNKKCASLFKIPETAADKTGRSLTLIIFSSRFSYRVAVSVSTMGAYHGISFEKFLTDCTALVLDVLEQLQ